MPSLVELCVEKAHLETELDELRERLSDADEQLVALRKAQRRGLVSPEALQRQEGKVLELRRDIQRCRIASYELGDRIAAAESQELDLRARQLEQESEAVRRELDFLRRDLLRSLVGLSGLLRRHQQLAAEKVRLAGELAKLTGRDMAYENYISCALLHQQDYCGEVQFVVDTLKKMRPVT